MSFSEIASKASELSKSDNKSSFDIDKRAEISPNHETSDNNEFDIDKCADVSKVDVDKRAETETESIGGGSYKEVKKNSEEGKEVHHMPADSVSPLERNDGPSIKMDKEDHRHTASYGISREAQEYRARQKELIDSGDFRGAVQMDIDDIKSKFGDKYDKEISQMLDYVDKLEAGGKI